MAWRQAVVVGVALLLGTAGSGVGQTRLLTLQGPPGPGGGEFGKALATLGDVNGDGVPDLAVGAPEQQVAGLPDLGQVFVFSGANGQRLHTLEAPTPQTSARFGTALARVGDVNGDGVRDLAIGARELAFVFDIKVLP
jgi:hypothetical protein